MIYIGTIRDVSNNYDENWLIVRSAKSIPRFSEQVVDLSPSSSLFYSYLNAKKAGIWNEQWFADNYVPQFIREIKSNPNAINLLGKLYHDSFTKDIVLCCYCPDEKLCHRSIIAGLLLGSGANISCDLDYIKYWNMFTNS